MPAEQVFNEARRIVTWHYQWMVLHDFVERLTEPGIVAKILNQGRKFYRFKKVPYMPVEFSAAAYRLGHSMVREVYSYNRIFTPGGLTPATLNLLFQFTGLSGQIIGDLAPNPPAGPLPLPVLSSNWIIDWRRFFKLGAAANPAGRDPQRSAKTRPLHRTAASRPPGRGRQSRIPKSAQGCLPGAAVRSGCRGRNADRKPADAGGNRHRTRWGGRSSPRPPSEDAALVLHSQGGAGPRRGRASRPGWRHANRRSLRRPRAWRPQTPTSGKRA